MALAPWRHNWVAPVLERYSWQTDVIEARNGAETRRALREFPRRTLEYRALVTGAGAADLEARSWAYGTSLWELPLWADQARLEADIVLGATAVPCETDLREFEEGGQAVLWAAWDDFEVVDILSVASNGLTLEAGTAAAWEAGARVVPLVRARRSLSASITRVTAGVGDSGLVWDQYDPVQLTPAAAAVSYRGIEVLEDRPNRAEGMDLDLVRKAETIDPSTGLVTILDQTGRPRVTTMLSFLWRTRALVLAGRDFLFRRAGRRHAFWMPTWQQDLEVVADIEAADDTLVVRDIDVEGSFGVVPGRQDIRIDIAGLDPIYRRVTSVDAGAPGTEVLTLDAAIGVDAAVATVRRVSWLSLCRLASDTIEVSRATAGVAQAAFGVVTLDEDETADFTA